MSDFSNLLPDLIFDAVEAQGYRPTGTLFPLNSYENRVYEIGLEEEAPLIVKFYRPGRWSEDAIWEEHRFLQALKNNDLPVISPLDLRESIHQKQSLGKIDIFTYCFYPKFRGRENGDLNNDDRRWLGRLLARIHLVGKSFKTQHRLTLNPQTYGDESLAYILEQEFLPQDLKPHLENILNQILTLIRPFFHQGLEVFPLHGDCHLGNVLWNHDGPHLLDFDDMVVAPPIQDIWMLFHGSPEEMMEQKKSFFEGYNLFREFDHSSFRLVEPLRTLRMIRHAAWIGHRYEEPLFQKAFPYYRERKYWEEFLLSMKEQLSLLVE